MYRKKTSTMKVIRLGRNLRGFSIYIVLPLNLIMVMLISSCSRIGIFEDLHLKSYESRVNSVIEQGTAIKNYLGSLEQALQEGDTSTIALMAPEVLRSLPPCSEQVQRRSDLPGVEIIHWKSISEVDRGNPWQNLANHWGKGSEISRSSFSMIHLNKIDKQPANLKSELV